MNQSGIFQFAKMLRHGRLGDGQHFVYVAEKTFVSLSEEMEDGEARRVAHGLGESCKAFLFRCYFDICHIDFLLVVREITNIDCKMQDIIYKK